MINKILREYENGYVSQRRWAEEVYRLHKAIEVAKVQIEQGYSLDEIHSHLHKALLDGKPE